MIKIYCDSNTLMKNYNNIDFSKLLLIEAFNSRNINFINTRTNNEDIDYKSNIIYVVNPNYTIEEIKEDLIFILSEYKKFNTIFVATAVDNYLFSDIKSFINSITKRNEIVKMYNAINLDTLFAKILVRDVIINHYNNIRRLKTKK
jgi:hypothetical protein